MTGFAGPRPRQLLAAAQREIEAEFGPLEWRAAGERYGGDRPYTVSAFTDGPLRYEPGPVDAVFERICATEELIPTSATTTQTGTFRRTAEAGEWELVLELRTYGFVGVRPAVAPRSDGPDAS